MEISKSTEPYREEKLNPRSKLKVWLQEIIWTIGLFALIIITTAQCLSCIAKFKQPPTATVFSLEETSTFTAPLVTICRDPFWDEEKVRAAGLTVEEVREIFSSVDGFWIGTTYEHVNEPLTARVEQLYAQNRTLSSIAAEIIAEPLMMYRNGFNVYFPILASDKPGLNVYTNWTDGVYELGSYGYWYASIQKGNWKAWFTATSTCLGPRCFCFTYESISEVQNTDTLEFSLKRRNDPPDTTWIVTVTSRSSYLSNTLRNPQDITTRVTVNDSVSITVQETRMSFVSTAKSPCNDDPTYSYNICHSRCAARIYGRKYGTKSDDACQIVGMRNYPGLPLCRSFSHETEEEPYLEGIRISRTFCDKECPKPCEQQSFTMHLERKKIGELAQVTITSVQDRRSYFKEIWNYSLAQMVAEFGGNIGMFLGISVLSIFRGSLFRG